jgi:hypothetical protein
MRIVIHEVHEQRDDPGIFRWSNSAVERYHGRALANLDCHLYQDMAETRKKNANEETSNREIGGAIWTF